MPGSDQAAVSAAHRAPRVAVTAHIGPKVLVWRPRDHTREYDWPGIVAVEQVRAQLRMPNRHVATMQRVPAGVAQTAEQPSCKPPGKPSLSRAATAEHQDSARMPHGCGPGTNGPGPRAMTTCITGKPLPEGGPLSVDAGDAIGSVGLDRDRPLVVEAIRAGRTVSLVR